MLKEFVDRLISLAEIQKVVQGDLTFIDRKVYPLVPPTPAPIDRKSVV